MAVILVHGMVIALFLTLGVLFLKGKASFLIAGYNTASDAEKAKTDEKKLCRTVGKLMFALAGCCVLFLLSALWDLTWLLWLGFALFLGLCAGAVIYLNTGNRLKK